MPISDNTSAEGATSLGFIPPRPANFYGKTLSDANLWPTVMEELITEFGESEPYEMLWPIRIRVRMVDGGYEASWIDGNIVCADDNKTGAIKNLGEVILDTFEVYQENQAVLGPEPKRQIALMRKHFKRSRE